ncbi:MAG: CRISPR-associated helicase Cas3' [Acidobacteriota bacterium]|nr:CRISPR-associated helicase Cas3' [Acidobacteriota bacterium]
MDAWGKFDQETGDFHRLEHHCADVAACFEVLLREPVLRARFARAAGTTELDGTTAARLTYLAFLHDFGKLNTGFQFKVPRHGASRHGRPRPAGHIGEALLCAEQEDLCELLGLYRILDNWGNGAGTLLFAALAHHGRPAQRPSRTGQGPPELWKPFASYDPKTTAKLLYERGRCWFPDAFEPGPTLPETPALAHLFAGVVALADQLGSDEGAFEFEPNPDACYIERARAVAAETVAEKKFVRSAWSRNAPVADVRTLFDYTEPRPLQQDAATAPLDSPLLILESETGSGKTEAAILRFASLWRAGIVDALYFAVPTRSAAKQLHARVHHALQRLFPSTADVQAVLAVPGYLRVGDAEGHRAEKFKVYWEDRPDEAQRLARWSAESARKYLTAPAAVGTVDQALLAGLQVKWAHLRAAALARSLLVVDEVHASDGYMTEVLRGALRAHLKVGGHALLMSATLGSTASSKFLSNTNRYTMPSQREAEAVPYPALTFADPAGEFRVAAIRTTSTSKTVAVSTGAFLSEPGVIARTAIRAAQNDAKVLVVRNTVNSARAVFAALLNQGGSELALEVAGEPTLHHGRFAAEDRRLLDDAVELGLGKENRSPGGSVVIGTQTLEQSLDIDADYLITDICPIDVLLQRLGRLHRHAATGRPAGFGDARCLVLVPDSGLGVGLDGSLLQHGLGVSDRGGIYTNLVGIEATRRLIEEHPSWTVPAMNRVLVERGTHPDALRKSAETLGPDWLSHLGDVVGRKSAETVAARNHALTRDEPFNEDLVFADLDSKVRTRLGEDGPRIELRSPVAGPFGSDVSTFNLPVHLFRRGLPGKEDIEAARAEPGTPGTFVLTVGDDRLLYDRTGIHWQEP